VQHARVLEREAADVDGVLGLAAAQPH
jgi:hypothetical protein